MERDSFSCFCKECPQVPAEKERPYVPGLGYHGGTLAKGCFMAHVDDQRVARVLDALETQHPGAQLLVNDPW